MCPGSPTWTSWGSCSAPWGSTCTGVGPPTSWSSTHRPTSTPRPPTAWWRRCGPRWWSSVRSSGAADGPRCPCPEATTSVPVPSTCTCGPWSRWGHGSHRPTATWRPPSSHRWPGCPAWSATGSSSSTRATPAPTTCSWPRYWPRGRPSSRTRRGSRRSPTWPATSTPWGPGSPAPAPPASRSKGWPRSIPPPTPSSPTVWWWPPSWWPPGWPAATWWWRTGGPTIWTC